MASQVSPNYLFILQPILYHLPYTYLHKTVDNLNYGFLLVCLFLSGLPWFSQW